MFNFVETHTNMDKYGISQYCCYCERKMNKSNKNLKPTTDHIIARSRGGNNSKANKCTCCALCNSYKSNHTPKEFADALESYLTNGVNPYDLLPENMLVGYARGTLSTILDNMRAKERKIGYMGVRSFLVPFVNSIKPNMAQVKKAQRNFKWVSDEDTPEYKIANDIALRNMNIFNNPILDDPNFWNTKNFHC